MTRNWGDGAWHNATTLLIAALLLVVPFGLSDAKYLWLSAGALIALFVNPDLDQDGLTIAETLVGKVLGLTGEKFGGMFGRSFSDFLMRIGKGFGLLFTGVWIAVWSFYAAFMPHRSFFSHFPVVGTSIRVLWLILVLSLLRHLGFILFSKWIDIDLTLYIMQLALLFIGLCLADLGHYARDMKWLVLERHLGINGESNT